MITDIDLDLVRGIAAHSMAQGKLLIFYSPYHLYIVIQVGKKKDPPPIWKDRGCFLPITTP